MQHTWFQWFYWCFIATLPYNLYGLLIIYLFPVFQKIGFSIGGLLIFSLFVTVFYWLDSWLMRRGYHKFYNYFSQVIVLRFVISLVGVAFASFIGEIIFKVIFIDFFMTDYLYRFMQSNIRETAQIMVTNHRWYSAFKILIIVGFFLAVEMVCILGGMIILGVTRENFMKNESD